MTLHDAKAFTWWLVQMWICGVAIAFVLLSLPLGRDDTDGAWPHRSGMKPRTDAMTGCQYLETSGGGITPRLDADGRQIGCREARQ